MTEAGQKQTGQHPQHTHTCQQAQLSSKILFSSEKKVVILIMQMKH